MNLANLPLFILFFAVVYLLSIYGLLIIAQMYKQGNNIVSRNSEETGNQVKIP